MTDQIAWCGQCREIFDPAADNPNPASALKCPWCGAMGSRLLDKWKIPNGTSGKGPAPWEFVCHSCGIYLEVPSPREPEEADRIACPRCGRRDMERLHVCSLENMGHSCFG